MLEHEHLERLLGAAAALDDQLQARALLGQDLVVAARLGIELGEDRGGLSVRLDLALLGGRLGVDDHLGLHGFGQRLELGALLRFDRFRLGVGRLRLREVLRLEHGGLRDARARLSELVGLGLLDLQFGGGRGDVRLGLVLARDGLRVRFRDRDPHRPLLIADGGLLLVRRGLLPDLAFLLQLGEADDAVALGLLRAHVAELLGDGDGDGLVAVRLGDAGRALLDLLRDVDQGLLDRLRSRLLADRLDVARLVRDVLDVDVDQDETDLPEFGLERRLDLFQEDVAVLVDLLDAHRRDHLTELTEDHVLGLLDDVLRLEAER